MLDFFGCMFLAVTVGNATYTVGYQMLVINVRYAACNCSYRYCCLDVDPTEILFKLEICLIMHGCAPCIFELPIS
jgi:hypothetical protein